MSRLDYPLPSGGSAMDPTIVYRSEAMSKAMALAERVAATDASVLITGESGTGKSLLAELIHRQSRRRGRPFVTIPCANIPAELFESELFGHEPGAHTDAVERRKGRFEAADGGTVFLDGVGALAPSLQPKLLRVLQDLTFQRLGGTEEIRVDVSFIAAADEVLEADARTGRFREDLFYRLNVVHVSLPPLRERVSDIAPLASYFLKRLAARYGGRPRRLTPGARRGLREYSWPGNVRELANVLESSVIGSDNGLIGAEGL